ncbi:sulfotransferase domain-containing protein [uncultured Martelella sp.]|uniref:sulfotransferase domain-containing protein n=1 Tax=uncultured Martelella sp. TaxID=392331 RepID=UPI0029C762F6|nr:sulfotransferase domain-containing protein [uncultured Martelella sp.]
MSKVDFFIIGAPKCGTTALAKNLDNNPSIVISNPKEPHYFTTDFIDYKKAKDLEEYHSSCFPAEKHSDVIWGDASIWTMYSEEGLNNIKKYNPDARIVIMLRNPAKAAFSLHQQMIFQKKEPVRSFRDAWLRSDERFKRNIDTNNNIDSKLISYKHAFSFRSQLKRVYEIFPSEQIFIGTQEDYIRDGVLYINRVEAFLGARIFKHAMNAKTNETFYMNNKFVMDLLRHPVTVKVAVGAKRVLGIKSWGLGRPAARITADDIKLVYTDLADDIAAVEADFGIKLT